LLSIKVPPQVPEYNCHVAPIPSEPPFTVSEAVPPAQIAAGNPVSDAGAVEFEFTVTDADAQFVVLHVPEAST